MISCCSTACTFDDPDDGADIARREIENGRQPRDIAVFYRTNSQSRLIEEEFKRLMFDVKDV